MREANASLRQQISRQEFSAEDVERQAAERRRVKEAMLNAQDAKAKARKVWYRDLSFFSCSYHRVL